MRVAPILDWYLLRRQLACLLAVSTLALTVSLVVLIVQDLDNLFRQEADWRQATVYFALRCPRLLFESMPVAVFLAVLANLGMLARRREISAMMSAGLSHARIALPLLLFSLLLAALLFAWNETLALPTDVQADEVWAAIKHDVPRAGTQLQFVRGSGHRLYALAFAHRRRLHNFVMLEMGAGPFRAPTVVLTARQAFWNHGRWNFMEGVLYRYDDAGNMLEARPFGLDGITYPIEETAEDFSHYQRQTDTMTLAQLWHFAGILRSVGESADELWPQIHGHFALPLAAVVMTLLASAVALHSWEERRAWRVALALLAAPAYLAFVEVCMKSLPAGPHLSAWLPNLLFGLLGAILLKRSSSY